MATSTIKELKGTVSRGLNNVSLNDLPDIFRMYGFWGGSGVSDYPAGVDPAGCALITIPISGASNQFQIMLTPAGKIYMRRKMYTNVWDIWGQV